MANILLVLIPLLGLVSSLFIFYSSMGIIYDPKTGHVKAISGENVTLQELFKLTCQGNRAAVLGYFLLWAAFLLQAIMTYLEP
jgi:hypothetical protein